MPQAAPRSGRPLQVHGTPHPGFPEPRQEQQSFPAVPANSLLSAKRGLNPEVSSFVKGRPAVASSVLRPVGVGQAADQRVPARAGTVSTQEIVGHRSCRCLFRHV